MPDGLNAVGNFDADPFPEVVLVSDGQVWLLEHNGAVKWGPVGLPGGGAGGPPTIADFDGDGQPDIGVAGATPLPPCSATDGHVKWSAITQDNTSNLTAASVFDFEADGAAEVVYGDETRLRVLRGDGRTVLFETPLSTCTTLENPSIADIDGDGSARDRGHRQHHLRLLVPSTACSPSAPPAESGPPRAASGTSTPYHITNVNDDGTIPAHEAQQLDQIQQLPPEPPHQRLRVREAGSHPLVRPPHA